MQAHDIDGRCVGTFDGKAGNQFELIDSRIDVYLQGTYFDEIRDERFYELMFRAHKPVDEFRIEIELPEYGWNNLISEIDDIGDE